MNAPASIKFIFHIGAGKTGTSSIQATLNQNRDRLLAQGIVYLGLMFEHAPRKLYPWQVFGGHDEFLALPRAVAEAQFRDVLYATIDAARSDHRSQLIWSSESFFDRFDSVLPALADINDRGVDVQILAYVRNHVSWAKSAYLQWGIKHKTIPGQIRPFGEWIKHRRPFFAPTLQSYSAALPGRVNVRNFDSLTDVVDDFSKFCNLPASTLDARPTDNQTPGSVEILLRALFNDRIKGNAFPVLFERQIGNHIPMDRTPDEFLSQLLPTIDDMKHVVTETRADREALNALLAAQGQDPLDVSKLNVRAPQVDAQVLLMALARLVTNQARRIDSLDHTLSTLASGKERPA